MHFLLLLMVLILSNTNSTFFPSRSSSVAILDQFQFLFGVDAETVAKSNEG